MGTWDTNFYSYPSCNPYDTMGLIQKEAMLGYNSRYNANVPSVANNWMASSVYSTPYFNPTFGGGFNSNIFAPPTFAAPTGTENNPAIQPPATQAEATTVNQPSTNMDLSANGEQPQNFDTPAFQGALKRCTEAYSRTNCIEDEGFKGALFGGAQFYAFENLQSLVHPKNAIKAHKTIKDLKVFEDITKDGTQAARLWKNNDLIMQEAYNETKKILRDAQPKKGWSGWFKRAEKGDLQLAKKLAERMKDAINAGNIEEVKKITAEMKCASGCSGKIPTLWNKIKGQKTLDASKRLYKAKVTVEKNGKKSSKYLEEVANIGKLDSGVGSLVVNTFKREFIGFTVFDMLFSLPKIWTCYQEDKKNKEAGLESENLALKQTGQSLVKASLTTTGWCLGKAVGKKLGSVVCKKLVSFAAKKLCRSACTKIGASIGTMFGPGVGTVIGSVIGFAVGSIGSWLANKGMQYLAEKKDVKLFQDKAGQIEAKNLAQSAEGTQQMLINLKEKIDNGEITDNQTIQSWRTVNLAMQQYAQQQALAEQAAAQQAAGQQVPQYV